MPDTVTGVVIACDGAAEMARRGLDLLEEAAHGEDGLLQVVFLMLLRDGNPVRVS